MDTRLELIYNHYGRNAQQLKCCEECAELIQALLKSDPMHIAEEIADVEITIEYMKEGFAVRELVEKFKELKINRQLMRMQGEKHEREE